jgi:spermine/spermidine synthase
MISRTTAFVVSLFLLAIAQYAVFTAKRRGTPFFCGNSQIPSSTRLLLASALTLFAELAFIRWISVEVRVFAYFMNLALLLCFLGFGFGCALVTQKRRWLPGLQSFLGLLLVVRIPWSKATLPEGLSQNLGGANDIAIWHTRSGADWASFVFAVVMTAGVFVLLVSIFVPLGQVVSKQMDKAASSLSAYSWNLIGSIAGVITFFLVSWWMLLPTVWMGLVLLGFAFLQENWRDAGLVGLLLVPLVLILNDPSQPGKEIIWTPYQEIEYTRQYTQSKDASGGYMRVNHTFYQSIVDLSPAFVAGHPSVQKEGEDNPYNVPFRFTVSTPLVLIVGSGTGNDVAAALRHNSRQVDAVEIDPAILELGRREHPEHPYDSPSVSVHLDDARSFLKRTKNQYDLILFGLLDSHAQFSDYSNMRIDNFVYTEEAFREASAHLTQDGIVFVKFSIERPWLEARFFEMLDHVFGHSPVVFRADSNYTTGGTCFVISRSSHVGRVS